MSCQQATQYLASSNNCPIDNDSNLSNNQNYKNNNIRITNNNFNNNNNIRSKNQELNINISNQNKFLRGSLSCNQRHTTASRRQRPRKGNLYGADRHGTTNRNGSVSILNSFPEDNDPYVFNEPVPTSGEVLSFQEQRTLARLTDSVRIATSKATISKTSSNVEHGILFPVQLHQVNKEQGGHSGTIFGQTKVIGSASDKPEMSSIASGTLVTSSVRVSATGINLTNNIVNMPEKMIQSNSSESIITKNIASNKKLTNVCIVRPQQQPTLSSSSSVMAPMAATLTESTLAVVEAYQLGCRETATDDIRVQTQTGPNKSLLENSLLPPLYTPSSNLWQTPLLLEMGAPSPFLISKTGHLTTHRQHPSSAVPKTELPYSCSVLPNSYDSFFSSYNHGNQLLCPDNQWNQGLNNGSSLSLSTSMTASSAITTTTAMAKVAPIVVHSSPTMQHTSTNKPALTSHLKNFEECIQPLYEHETIKNDDDCLKTASKLFENVLNNENDHTNETASSLHAFDVPQKHSNEEKLNVVVNNYGTGSVYRAVTTIPPTAVVPPARAVLDEQHKTEFTNSNGKELHSSPLKLLEGRVETKNYLCDNEKKEYLKPALIKPSAGEDKNNHLVEVADNNKKLINNGNNDKWNVSELNSSDKKQNNLQLLKEECLYSLCKNSDETVQEKVLSNTSEPIKVTSNSSGIGQKRKHYRNSCSQNEEVYNWYLSTAKKGAVAVVQVKSDDLSVELFDHDRKIENLSRVDILPYCIPSHWLYESGHLELGANVIEHRKNLSDVEMCSNVSNDTNSKQTKSLFSLERSLAREERIATYKQQLRRQSMQYKATRSLQKVPLQLCKKRLIMVDRLLRKYRKENENRNLRYETIKKNCSVVSCNFDTVPLSDYCARHLVQNSTQHFIRQCTALLPNSDKQCSEAVFDVLNEQPLCQQHSFLFVEQQSYSDDNASTASNCISSDEISKHNTVLKENDCVSETKGKKTVSRRLSQVQVSDNHNDLLNSEQSSNIWNENEEVKTNPAVLSSVLPSFESPEMSLLTNIGYQSSYLVDALIPEVIDNAKETIQLPALAPLSDIATMDKEITTENKEQHNFSSTVTSVLENAAIGKIPVVPITANNTSVNTTITATLSNSIIPCYSSSIMGHSMSPLHTSSGVRLTNNSLPGNLNYFNTNSNSNFTSSGIGGSTTSLLSVAADEFLTQEVRSICENSSVTSEDTGLGGGLSDPELMLGTTEPDVDDIPLSDGPLLEDHDLANVLNSFPEDAFKELFNTVRQDESDEIERAILIADKNLKSLQQTIGGSGLGDFLDFNDDILGDTGDFCNATATTFDSLLSPDLLDTSNLFLDHNEACQEQETLKSMVTAPNNVVMLQQNVGFNQPSIQQGIGNSTGLFATDINALPVGNVVQGKSAELMSDKIRYSDIMMKNNRTDITSDQIIFSGQ